MARRILRTDYIVLREAVLDKDAPFILELLNTPSWLAGIGDRGVKTLEDANRYIQQTILDSYKSQGFGLWVITDPDDGGDGIVRGTELPDMMQPRIGLCGLLKRDFLADPDIGYALLPQFEGRGYAVEAVNAVIHYAAVRLGFKRLMAITSQDNFKSMFVLDKTGFLCSALKKDENGQLVQRKKDAKSQEMDQRQEEKAQPEPRQGDVNGHNSVPPGLVKSREGELLFLFYHDWVDMSSTTQSKPKVELVDL